VQGASPEPLDQPKQQPAQKPAEPPAPNLMRMQVLERPGWSRTLLERLLGEPDLRKPQRGQRNPLALYDLGRVLAAEQSAAFAAAQAALQKRQAAAAKAVETKTEKLLAQVREMRVHVERHSPERVRAAAIHSFNARAWERGRIGDAGEHSDPEFLERITVNFIRHELTCYDEALWETAGRVGCWEARSLIRAQVYAAIAKAYPALARECTQQLALRGKGGLEL
jgi:hypothetical protein